MRPQPPVSSDRDRENDDEIWKEKKRIQTMEVQQAVERAKQRKEEEEKRFEESRRVSFDAKDFYLWPYLSVPIKLLIF